MAQAARPAEDDQIVEARVTSATYHSRPTVTLTPFQPTRVQTVQCNKNIWKATCRLLFYCLRKLSVNFQMDVKAAWIRCFKATEPLMMMMYL